MDNVKIQGLSPLKKGRLKKELRGMGKPKNESANHQAQIEKEASRYRWLRDSPNSGSCIRALYEDGGVIPDAVDKMIDEAIGKESSNAN